MTVHTRRLRAAPGQRGVHGVHGPLGRSPAPRPSAGLALRLGVWRRRATPGSLEQVPAALVPGRAHAASAGAAISAIGRRTPGRAARTRRARGWWGSAPPQGFLDSWSGEVAVGSGQAEPKAHRRWPPASGLRQGAWPRGGGLPATTRGAVRSWSAPHGPLPGQAASLPQFPHLRQGNDTCFRVSAGADPPALPEALHTHSQRPERHRGPGTEGSRLILGARRPGS